MRAGGEVSIGANRRFYFPAPTPRQAWTVAISDHPSPIDRHGGRSGNDALNSRTNALS